jgi:hypothetical protein
MLQGLFKKLKSMELEFDTITNYYDLIKMYNIEVSDLELASYAMMNPDFTSCKDAMDVVEENKLENIKAFSADLVKEVENLRKDIIRIRASAQNEMILSAGKNLNAAKSKPPSMM